MMNIKSIFNSKLQISQKKLKPSTAHKRLLTLSLLFILTISCISSCTLIAQGTETLENTIHVSTDPMLKEAVNNAAGKGPITIIFDQDIGLIDSTLTIPYDADITLTSNKQLTTDEVEFFSLYGLYATTANVINVSFGSILKLDGIIVTHFAGSSGTGVIVESGGELVISNGIISGNTLSGNGAGVFNSGTFRMLGGVISGNTAYRSGAGVFNSGSFELLGGVISGNTATDGCGGVANAGTFSMLGGVISGNVGSHGGGVSIGSGGSFELFSGEISGNGANFGSGGVTIDSGGSFVMSGGVISGNSAGSIYGGGGGVANAGTFSMLGGVISGNTATRTGGGVNNGGVFSMSGGVISGNKASTGGGVNNGGVFSMSGGVISGNTAGNGGGIAVSGGLFTMHSGRVSGNVASGNGGGVWVTDSITDFNRFIIPVDAVGVVFEDNRASAAYNRAQIFDHVYNMYIQGEASWTAPFTQGYNNYDVSYVYGTPLAYYTVAVVGSNALATGAGRYIEGARVNIDAGTAPMGQKFQKWTATPEITFDKPNSANANFIMPAYSVEVTANFVDNDDIAVLSGLKVDPLPTKMAYFKGEALDLTGMTVTAIYSDESRETVTDYTVIPADGTVLHDVGEQLVIVGYTQDNILTVYDSFTVTVLPPVNSPTVHADSAIGRAGQEVALLVSLENNPGIASYSITMRYPDTLTYVSASPGDILSANFYADTSIVGQVTLTATSPMGTDISTGTVLFTVIFKINAGVGDCVIGELSGLSLGYYTDRDGIEHNEKLYPYSVATQPVIIVRNTVYGDVNGDGSINTLDVTRLLRYIRNIDTSLDNFVPANADVNGDGVINTLDVTRLLRYIQNVDPSPLGPKDEMFDI